MRLTKSVVLQIGHYVIVLLTIKDVVVVEEVCPGVYVDVSVLGKFDDELRVISIGSSVQRFYAAKFYKGLSVKCGHFSWANCFGKCKIKRLYGRHVKNDNPSV